MDGYVLDTHVLIWFLEANQKLSSAARDIIETFDGKLYIPAICVLEAVDILTKRKLDLTLADYEQAILIEDRIEVIPIDAQVAMRTKEFTHLPDIHDRCIIAVTLSLLDKSLDVALITADQRIQSSGLVPTVW
jgi:PIN domain nuclease of toxin-antitoxin system